MSKLEKSQLHLLNSFLDTPAAISAVILQADTATVKSIIQANVFEKMLLDGMFITENFQKPYQDVVQKLLRENLVTELDQLYFQTQRSERKRAETKQKLATYDINIENRVVFASLRRANAANLSSFFEMATRLDFLKKYPLELQMTCDNWLNADDFKGNYTQPSFQKFLDSEIIDTKTPISKQDLRSIYAGVHDLAFIKSLKDAVLVFKFLYLHTQLNLTEHGSFHFVILQHLRNKKPRHNKTVEDTELQHLRRLDWYLRKLEGTELPKRQCYVIAECVSEVELTESMATSFGATEILSMYEAETIKPTNTSKSSKL